MKLNNNKSLAIFALTTGGKALAQQLASDLDADIIDTGNGLAAAVKNTWEQYQGLVFIMASGIVVRLIAPLLKDKKNDPGVVVIDEKGKFAISLLSGHLGGGNRLASEIAQKTHGQAVITTASDTLGLTALDLWAQHNNLHCESGSFTSASAILVNNGSIKVFNEIPGTLPEDLVPVATPEQAEIIISHKLITQPKALVLRPKNLVMGVGCNRGTSEEAIKQAFSEACSKNNLATLAVEHLASIDLKNDEPGLLDFCKSHKFNITFFNASQLNQVPGITRSKAVFKATGSYGVAEPAALLAAKTDILLIRKMKWKDVTIAIAQKAVNLTANYQ